MIQPLQSTTLMPSHIHRKRKLTSGGFPQLYPVLLLTPSWSIHKERNVHVSKLSPRKRSCFLWLRFFILASNGFHFRSSVPTTQWFPSSPENCFNFPIFQCQLSSNRLQEVCYNTFLSSIFGLVLTPRSKERVSKGSYNYSVNRTDK